MSPVKPGFFIAAQGKCQSRQEIISKAETKAGRHSD
jgi:hypothetical protein